MITREQIRIYKKYIGDIDAWAGFGTRRELEIMSDDDWLIVSEIVRDLDLVLNKHVSADFAEKLREKIKTITGGDAKAVRGFYQLASDDEIVEYLRSVYSDSRSD